MPTMVRRKPAVRLSRRAATKPVPQSISLQKTFEQIIEIMEKTKSPEMCLLIGDNNSSIVVSRYKDTVQIICDIPGVLMEIDITIKDADYKAVISTSAGWKELCPVAEFTNEIDFSDSDNENVKALDKYDRSNLKMLINLVEESFNIVQGGNTNVGTV